MNVAQFFHVCRSAAAIADVREITVFGAAAVIPWVDIQSPRAAPWPSMELDVDPGSSELADLVDGSIGEASSFEEAFGVYAHGVSLEAFIAPPEWQDRARVFVEPQSGERVRTPHPLDLTVAKLVSGDPRDWEFATYCRTHLGIAPGEILAGLREVARSRPDYAAAAEVALGLVSARLRD